MDKKVITGIAIIIFLIVVYFVGKSYGKSLPPDQTKLPDDPNNPGKTGTGIKADSTISAMTDRVFNDIEGINWLGYHDGSIYTELVAFSDVDLVKVSNDWLDRYFNKHNETLLNALKAETFVLWSPENVTNIISRLELLTKK